MAGPRVRRFSERDIAFAIRLTNLERWGYTRADFERLIALEPKGCFVAELGGKRVGLTCSTVYGPLAFVGAVIVDPRVRGKGVGDALLRATLDYLDGRGVETVRLNAYLNVIPFYERLGFHGEYENGRYAGHLRSSGTAAPGVRVVREDEITALADFDAPLFGAERAALLAHLAREFPQTFLVAKARGRFRGYIVGNPSDSGCEVGPWVVDPESADAASELLHALVGIVRPEEIALSIPKANPRESKLVDELRLQEVFRTLRMYRGRRGFEGNPEAIFAMAGLEKG